MSPSPILQEGNEWKRGAENQFLDVTKRPARTRIRTDADERISCERSNDAKGLSHCSDVDPFAHSSRLMVRIGPGGTLGAAAAALINRGRSCN